MNLIRILHYSIWSSVGVLLFAGTVPAQSELDMKSIDAADECMVAEICIDRYLNELYERTPKVDSIQVPETIQVTVKHRGKTKTVTRTIMKPAEEDFTWKDPKAAEAVGMSVMDYVIGGMDRGFKTTLYHALRALDEAGFVPGITSGFRDDYRQSIATGQKAQNDRSYHGGSLRGGYGHGLAADIVSVRGATRAERFASSQLLWKWIDANGKDFGVGRPYLDRDPPHVGPIDGKEYADHRLAPPKPQVAEVEAKSKKNQKRLALHEDHSLSKHAKATKAKLQSRRQTRAT
jgi:hypothetical protein